jgi:hypothetical protein
LEGMVESRDELIIEIAKEIGLDHMGEDAKDEDEDEDGNDGGDVAAPPVVVAAPNAPTPPVAATPKEVVEEVDLVEMVPEQEAPMAHEVILAGVEPGLLQPRLYRMIMRDYKESPPRMMDDLDEWFPKDGSNDQD